VRSAEKKQHLVTELDGFRAEYTAADQRLTAALDGEEPLFPGPASGAACTKPCCTASTSPAND
jgi:hypothetical protein